MRYPVIRSMALAGLLICSMASVSLAQASDPDDSRSQWWTAWTCEVTPVRAGPVPETISGVPDDVFWLQATPTSDTTIELIVWLWTGNRPLPVNGIYEQEEMFTKWLWAFSEPMSEIAVDVTSDTGVAGEVQFGGMITGSSTGPVNGWPSYAVVPEPGCYTFTITATAQSGAVFQGEIVFPAVP